MTEAASAGFNGGRWRLLSIVLVACLAVSVGFNIYMYLADLGYSEDSKVFAFEWPATQQNITEGTLRIEALFNWQSDSLNMTVNVNDDDNSSYDYLGLVFDKNRDEDFYNDPPFLLYGNNHTRYHSQTILSPSGRLQMGPRVLPHLSPYHTCIFNKQTGYTFRISIPKQKINFTLPMRAHLVFEDNNAYLYSQSLVWVRFELK